MKEVKVKVLKMNDKSLIKKESMQNADGDTSITEEYLKPFDYDVLVKLYEENVYHQSCIEAKAIATVGMGYEIKRKDGKDVNNKDEEYRKLEEFLEAHAEYTGQTFTETMVQFATDWELFADAYFELVLNNKGELAEIYHLPSINTFLKKDKAESRIRSLRRLVIQRATDKDIVFYPFTEHYRKRRPDGNYYVRISNYTPKNTIYGVPGYITALISLSLMRAGQSYNLSFLNNNGMPSYAIIVENGNLSEEAFKSLEQYLTNEFKGADNAGKGIILETGAGEGLDEGKINIKIEELSKMPKDGFYRFLKLDARDDIIAAHRVPPRLVGVSGGSKLGDTTESAAQLRQFKELVIKPRKRRVEFFLNKFIVENGLGIKDYKIEFNEFKLGDEDEPEDVKASEELTAVAASLNLNGAQIQAATKIIESVSGGLIPRSSGLNQLKLFFGLSADEAELLLADAGTGQKIIPDKVKAEKSDEETINFISNLKRLRKQIEAEIEE